MNLKEVLQNAKENNIALGHFNISDSNQFNGIINVAKTLNVPVIVGVSEGEKKFIGIHNAVALVRSARRQGLDVFLNLDHAHSVDDCKEAIDAGFDSVMFDGSKLSFEENIARTREVAEYAKFFGEKTGKIVLVEGELGYIGSSSKMLDEIPEDAGLEKTTAEQAREFVKKTEIDILAPSVGNLHGMLKGATNPDLDIERIKKISEALPHTFLVLHGGSGIKDDEFKKAIEAGINIVHINTEIRKAYRSGIENGLQNDTEQIAPYKYLNFGREELEKVVLDRIKLFYGAE